MSAQDDRKDGMQKCHVERSETSFALERFSAKDPSLTLRMTEVAHRMTKGTHRMTEGTPRMTGLDTHEDKMAFKMTRKTECKIIMLSEAKHLLH